MHDFLIPAIITLAAVILFSVVYAIFIKRKNRIMSEILEQKFGKIPEHEFGLKYDSISSYWYEKLLYDAKDFYVDDTTWNDLDMDKIYKRINSCFTSIGEEYLYATLHEPEMDIEELNNREEIIFLLESDSELRRKIQMILSKIGKKDYSGLSGFCYDVSSKRLKNPRKYIALALLPIVFVILFFINHGIGIAGLFLSVFANGIIHYFDSIRISAELTAIKYFSAMLWGANEIGQLLGEHDLSLAEDLINAHNTFKKAGGKMSSVGQQRLSDFDSIIEYFKIISLSDIRQYNKVIDKIDKNIAEFRKLFTGIGEIDMALNTLSFRKSLPFYSLPKFIDENKIISEEIYHPLIDNPVCNTITIPRYSMISGANASGKSTFIKAIALNAIMAQTLNTCTAKSFLMKHSHIATSMAIRDDVSSGDSYFISEIKSMKRIVDSISKQNCICVFDEILRGTNTIERIAASTSVLEHIASHDCICIVATHDIELTNILDGLYQNYHFSEKITSDGVVFDYIIKDGPTKTRNAITLLDFLDFDKEITSHANKLVEKFEKTKKWKD